MLRAGAGGAGRAAGRLALLEQGDAFARTGRALAALAAATRHAYAAALDEIVADFAARDRHLAGVAVADTALVLERLAEPRGLAARPVSPLIPASVYSESDGAIAQLGERRAGSAKVTGSSPVSSILAR